MFLRLTRSFSSKHGRISKGLLEGPSNTSEKLSSQVSIIYQRTFTHLLILLQKRRPVEGSLAIIYTLDPNKFAEKNQKRLHLKNRGRVAPYISLHKQPSPVVIPQLTYDFVMTTRVPYPPDTKAFLYYSISPEKPRIAGELRLRVASSDDAASFESGSDLVLVDGRPWSRPLPFLRKTHFPLYVKLREDGFVPDDLDRALLTLISKSNVSRYNGGLRLYTLNDPFIIDFDKYTLYSLLITEKAIEKMTIREMFQDHRNECKILPYTGAHTNLYPISLVFY